MPGSYRKAAGLAGNALLLCLLLLVIGCRQASGTELFSRDGEIRIPMGESVTVDLGRLPRDSGTVLLDLLARLDAESYAGSSFFMKLELNGEPVTPAPSREVTRLVNRKLVSPVAAQLEAPWFGNNAWRVPYGPDFLGARGRRYYQGNPHQTVLDVTDLINPAGANRLTITNSAQRKPPEGSRSSYQLVIGALKLRAEPGESRMTARAAADRPRQSRGAAGAGAGAGSAPYQGRLLPGGGFSITVGKRTVRFASRVSYPDAGFNELLPARAPLGGQRGFRVSLKARADGGEVVAAGPDYRITRKVRFTSRRVEVSDQVVNLRRDKLGLIFENRALLDEPDPDLRLAGSSDNAVNSYYSPGNPTVHFSLGGAGVGMIIEDDVFRNQATLFYDPQRKAAGLRTERLCLPAGGSYTLRWSVYPVASGDYFDFVNLVRGDWGANYTVEGAWTFINVDTILATAPEKIRAEFTRLGITRACIGGGWVDRKKDPKRIGFGAGVMDDYWADYRNRVRTAARRVREAVPGCKVYLYYDTQRDSSERGEERFADSRLIEEKGGQAKSRWGGAFYETKSYVATLDNSFGKAMLEVAGRYLTEIGVDGLYWDEMEAVGYGRPLITYNARDGHSCELDPRRFTVQREIGITTLLGESHRIAVIRKVRGLGGDIMGNSPNSTRKMLELKPQRMVETQHNDNWAYEGNLGTPLGYAGARKDFGNWVRAIEMATLLVGTRYDYPYDFSRYVFPFTPIELHAGYLLGKERIVATRSGSYGWPGERVLCQGYHFDSDGRLVPRAARTTLGKEARTAVDLAPKEAVVLVKLPVSLSGGASSVEGVNYRRDGLSFTINSGSNCAFEVRSGGMPVRPGASFRLSAGGRSQTLGADRDGVLRFSLPGTGRAVAIDLTPL